LTTSEERAKFDQLLASLLKTYFSYSLPSGDYFSSCGGQKVFTKLSRENYESQVTQGLLAYEREFKEMRLHLVDEAV